MAHNQHRSIVREISVRCQVSGKALAAGITANLVDQEPAASAVPLTDFSNDGKWNGGEVYRSPQWFVESQLRLIQERTITWPFS